MTFNYASTARTADRLLKQFGTSAELVSTTTGAYDPTTGTVSTATTTQNVTAAVFDYSQRYIDGTLIKLGDQQAYVSAVGITAPKQGDTLAWQGKNYSVINAQPISPAGMDVLYQLQVRHG